MSAKELGQIHTATDTATITAAAIGTAARRYDIAGLLSDKLQRLVRQGNYFKLCGIDMSIEPNTTGPGDGGQISGYFRYYTPTKGRCAAFRHAFKSMANQMKMQGIPMRVNAGYDFKVSLTNGAAGPVLLNQATLDGTNGLALDGGSTGFSVFDVYNESVVPTLATTPTGDLFAEGFDTLLQSGAGKTDFVLNEAAPYQGNEHLADKSTERIPFQLSYGPAGETTLSLQWRPDPALYVAVLTGNMEMVVEDVKFSGAATALEVEVAIMVSGWKSIMGNPEKKTRRSRKKA